MSEMMAIDSHIDTRRIESAQWVFEGALDEKICTRVAGISEDHCTDITVKLALQREARNEVRITGSAIAKVQIICQRCLQTFTCDIKVDFDEIFTEKVRLKDRCFTEDRLVNAESEQSDYFDKEGRFRLLHYIEDEILLLVPAFPVHTEERHCDKEMIARLNDKAEVEEENHNPFSVLKDLR